MRRLILVAPLLFASLSPAAALVGGAPAVQGPQAAVMIVGSRGNSCTGIAVARDLVLTAAHCVPPGADYKLVAFDAQRQPQLRDTQSIARHPSTPPRTPLPSSRTRILFSASPLGPANKVVNSTRLAPARRAFCRISPTIWLAAPVNSLLIAALTLFSLTNDFSFLSVILPP